MLRWDLAGIQVSPFCLHHMPFLWRDEGRSHKDLIEQTNIQSLGMGMCLS